MFVSHIDVSLPLSLFLLSPPSKHKHIKSLKKDESTPALKTQAYPEDRLFYYSPSRNRHLKQISFLQ